MNTKLTNYPEEEGDERAVEILKGLAKAVVGSSVPLGSFITEALELFYKRPIEKRRENWMEELVIAFNELSKKVNEESVGKLSENEEFITILHRATDIALKTHAKEKRLLLRNAIVSAGLPTPPEIDKQILFLRLIDELTVNQVLVLVLYRDPIGWFERRKKSYNKYTMAGRIEVLKQAYPELARPDYVNEIVLTGIQSRGLVSGLSGTVSGDSVYGSSTSKIANEFLDFVKADSIDNL